MSDNVDEFIADVPNAGVDTRSMDFVAKLDLDADCNNVTSGILRGLGPRYGMAPLIAQNILSTVATTGSLNTYGIYGCAASTSDTNRSMYGIFRVYGILPVQMIDQSDVGTTNAPKLKKTYFFVACMVKPTAGSASGEQCFQFVPLGQMVAAAPVTSVWQMEAALSYGLLRTVMIDDNANAGNYPHLLRIGPTANNANDPDISKLTSIALPSGFVDWAQCAVFTSPGGNETAAWIVGEKIANGGATTSATMNFTVFGVPNFVIDRTFPKDFIRTWRHYNVGQTIGLEVEYDYNATPLASDMNAAANQNTTTAHLTNTWVTGATAVNRIDGTAPTYAQVQYVLWNDEQNKYNTAYTLLLAAAQKPIAMMVQGWNRGRSYSVEQWVDLRLKRFAPPTYETESAVATRYTEAEAAPTGSATTRNTCFQMWPNFVRGTALPTDAASARNGNIHVTLGTGGSGVLRTNTVYEITYSIYDKSTGVESNVGVPTKIQTGGADYVALSLYRDSATGANANQRLPINFALAPLNATYFLNLPSAFSDSSRAINYVQIRFYYRPEGSFEWLPALFIDAAKYFYYPNHAVLWACTGASIGSTGGQPGAFNDYSDLPDEAYTSVLVWKNRVFWLSDKNLYFSMTNNGFCYPIRNAVPIPQGAYKGALVHNYPGQADQDSRLVVFSTRETYVGKFTGVRQQMWVQVSADEGGQFDIDGSDFVLNTWTSVTAFSYRSACVADGILYWWGPQGVYRDDGRDTPTKISDPIEPYIFDLYAKKNTDHIHCTYSEQTKEIIWFYFTKANFESVVDTDPQTKMLIYNTQTEQFTFSSMRACVDAAQKINVGDGVSIDRSTFGDRTVVFARDGKASTTSPQLAYFFDYKNRAGDMDENTQNLVSVIATPSSGSRRLTLPNGASTFAVGDYISTDQINAYTNDTDSSASAITVENFVGKVTAVNTSGTNYIDVLLPSDISSSFVGAATLGALHAFPIYVNKTIYHASTPGNAFPYSLETTYWCPGGLAYNAFWLYLHMLFKVELLKAEGLGLSPGFTLSHRTPISLDWASQTIVFGREVNGVWDSTLNTGGDHQQTYHPLSPGVSQFEGQGIKLKFSGLHWAHKWVLQYLAAYANPQTYDFLKQFEG